MIGPAAPMSPYEPPHGEAAPPKGSTRRTLLIIGGTLVGLLCLMIGTCSLLIARTVSVQGKDLTLFGPSFQRERNYDRHLLITRVPSPFLAPRAPSLGFGDPCLWSIYGVRAQRKPVT
jgi:hypothetical protein